MRGKPIRDMAIVRDRVNMMKLGGTATLQEEADEEDTWSSRLSNLWSSLTSNEHLPKKFRKFIKEHGRTKIQSLSMMRAPVAKPGTMAMELLTLGKWDEFKKRAGIDSVYHTSLVINGNFILEKLEKLEGRVDPGYTKQKDAEMYAVPIEANKYTIAEFLEKGRKQMGEKFYTYSAFSNNCQNWVQTMVSANGLLDEEGRKFIKQDIEKLIKELPTLTKWGAEKLTDVARNVGNPLEELVAKRGGQVFGHQVRLRGRGGL